jgi:hypothetical protein
MMILVFFFEPRTLSALWHYVSPTPSIAHTFPVSQLTRVSLLPRKSAFSLSLSFASTFGRAPLLENELWLKFVD